MPVIFGKTHRSNSIRKRFHFDFAFFFVFTFDGNLMEALFEYVATNNKQPPLNKGCLSQFLIPKGQETLQ